MIKWYVQDARLGTKLRIGVAALVAVMIMAIGLLVAQKVAVDALTAEYQAAARAQMAVSDVKLEVASMRVAARDALRLRLAGDTAPGAATRLTAAHAAAKARLAAARSHVGATVSRDIDAIAPLIDAYLAAASASTSDAETRRDAIDRDLLQRTETLLKDLQAREDAAGTRMREMSAQAVMIGVTAILAAIALGVGFSMLMQRTIARPVGRMTETITRLAHGDYDVAADAGGRRDEIGDLAQALEVFRSNAKEAIRLRAEQDAARAAAEAERARTEAAKAAAAAELKHAIDALAVALGRVSKGDLTADIAEAFPPAYARLRDDFNATLAQLRDPMRNIIQNAAIIRSGAQEISTAADDLSRRTEQQAASLEETAAALDEVTATISATASGSKRASTIVQAAREEARSSGAIVREAVDAMAAIESSAQKISQIISVVDEIAFQTNLLALNAGVEAARAGDAGRGFAVVAQEVRALAQRSADAAREVKQLITESTGYVESGVALVGRSGDALQRIVARVSEIDGLVSEIAASAEQQSAALSQVNAAINQMDQVTQQNAAMVEESTAASHELARGADALDKAVGAFTLEMPDAAPARASATPAPLRRAAV
ncbi:MAG: HAMP domain-containing protein [Alphaproteobacteria bacterium]|nr:HAMP domain-containing protein [Alphaproteobacteria bacterium]